MPSNSISGSGNSVNHYQILEKLGAGGMGVVYKAHDTKLNRTVALKFLPAGIQSDESNRGQFLREAQAASALDHANIGAIHAIEETAEGVSFIVMAYYEGETLSQRIKRSPLPTEQAVPIAIQMARGLAEAHSHQIVHRDIKPSNVIITRQGLAKIVDFGLARAIQSADSTASAVIGGTVYYMSPEQALGRPLDQRTDLWSLGVVLCEMLTGHKPFQGESTPALLFAVANAAPAHVDELPAGVQPIVYRALAKDRAQRYQTAAEMAADLENLEVAAGPGETKTIAANMARYVESASRSLFPAQPAQPQRRRFLVPAAAALVLASVLLLVPPVRQRLGNALWGPAEKHIAVLPFSVLGSSEGGEPLADGLMEALTSRLSNLEGREKSMWVVPASEVRRRKVADAAAAQREFGATLVVTGTLQRSGQGVRLIVNLIDAKRMRQLGSEEVEDRTGDFAMLQDSAVQKLAKLMNVAVTGDLFRSAGSAVSPAAYEYYLKAIGLIGRYDKPGNLDQAVTLLESAVKSDPGFALAYAGLGEAYLMKYKTDQNSRWVDQASAACQRAAQINDQLAPVYVTLGRIHIESAKIDLASQEFQHALQLDPRSPGALFGLAGVYEKQARLPEAEATLLRATALRPDYWDGYASLGVFYYRQRRWEEAAVRFRKVVELVPDNSAGWLNLAAALRAGGKLNEATEALKRSIQISPSYGAYVNLGNVHYQQRQFAEAARQYEKALALNDKDFRVWHNLANVYIWLNRDDEAQTANRRALPLMDQAVKLSPRDSNLQAALGVLYAKVHDRAQAFAHLEAGFALAPKSSEVMGHMAEAYEVLGERPKAVEWLNQAVASGYSMDSLRNDAVLHKLLTDPNFHGK